MKIKLIATDLDGTLLRNDKTISEKTKKILKNYIAEDGKLIITTGRAYFGTKWIADELDIKGIVITYNGARIYDREKDEIIYHKVIEESVVKKIIEISREKKVHLNLYQDDDWFVESKKSKEAERYTKACGKEAVEKPFHEFKNYEMTKALFIGEKENLDLVRYELVKRLGDSIYITSSHSTFLEILNKDVNKGAALKKIAQYYGIDREKIAAFGDEMNDKEMLEYAGYGVAMKNANPELKRYARYETLSNEEDGVAEFIVKELGHIY
ncbi:MAG: Cof-type HAD-IIB family hydrolase [Fusobacteriaceae bacterium]